MEDKRAAHEFFPDHPALAEFDEAACYLKGAYKVLRRLAGEAIRTKDALMMKLAIVRQLAVDLEHADDVDYMRRVARAIQDTIDN